MEAERHPKLPALSIKMLSDVTLLEHLKHPRTSGVFLVRSSWDIQTLFCVNIEIVLSYTSVFFRNSQSDENDPKDLRD